MCVAAVPDVHTPPAGTLPCYPAGELDAIDREVTIRFEGDASAGTLVCRAADGSRDLSRIQARVYQALVYMKRIRFDAPLPWTAEPLYDWFTGVVYGIRIRTDIQYSFCEQATHVLNLLGTRELADGPETSIPGYLQLLVHEARHIDGGAHTCGFTRDNTIGELGAYGTQYSRFLWIGQHDPTATAEERSYALNHAASLRCSVFCAECG